VEDMLRAEAAIRLEPAEALANSVATITVFVRAQARQDEAIRALLG
jgi:hypothetical protein